MVELTREEVLQALRARVLRPGAVFEGFHGMGVVEDPVAGLLVVFRWRADPTTYALSVPVETTASGALAPVSVSTGEPVESLLEWVVETVQWLSEEVGTGLVRRARRSRRGGVVHLDARDSTDVMPPGYYVGGVHLGPDGDAGGHLARVGLDVSAPRRALEQGRLVTWLHAYVDNHRGEPVVGHAALTWDASTPKGPGGRALLEVLEVSAGTPEAVAAALAFHGLSDAAETGAREAVAASGGPVLAEVGFTGPRAGGWRVLRLSELRQPDMHR